MDKLNIAFIGNWNVPWTTEYERAWSFRKLGHNVQQLQENETKAKDILDLMNETDLLLYSHTHEKSWEIDGLESVFNIYKANRIPTASCHLDRWAWLKRVEDVGKEATWKCEFIFMADGSPEAVELYDKYKLNWYWLKPGVIERDCYIANPDHPYPYDIVFTGSKGYHPEYPYRPELINFLHKTYGEHFQHFGNDGTEVLRMNRLNDLYASAKIVVGDSCFGGRPRYVSDRYYEVRGRGGVLIHPHVEGIETHGVINYEHGNLEDLKSKIDYYLEHDQEREDKRWQGHEWVKNNETYTHRSQEMLKIIFKEEP